ncbi:MAG: methionine aminotransferase [Bacteroidota bacterium]
MQQPKLTSKLPEVGTTIFSVMSALATEHNAINLSQGFPDFPVDQRLRDRVAYHIANGANQYAPMPGLPRLRNAISKWVNDLYDHAYDPASEITVTSGATEAIFNSVMALVQPGDEVVVLEPAYDAYLPAIRMCGGIPRSVPLVYPDYHIPWDKVRAMVNERTRVLMLNFPHNPTGAILQEEDIRQLKELVQQYPIYLISDEVWEHRVFDGHQHLSISRFPELAARSFVISSFGKALHATGWKVGYCLAPAALTREFRKVHQFVTFSTATPLQHAITDYLTAYPEEIRGLPVFYQEKRDRFLELMAGSAFNPLPARSTYFQLFSYADRSDRPDTEIARELTIRYKVASIPISVFYQTPTDDKVLRFCFAKEVPTLAAAAEKLKQVEIS